MRNPFIFISIFIVVLLIIDFYAYRGVKKLIVDLEEKTKRIIKILFWIVPFGLIAGLISISQLRDVISPEKYLIFFHFTSGTFILFYVPKLIFIFFNFIDDLLHGTLHIFSRKKKENIEEFKAKKITRSKFLTQVGIITAGIPFLALAYGIAWGRFDLIVRKLKIEFDNLPQKFNGLKIVQISDFHMGSFLNQFWFVEEVVEKVNSLKPDLLLFTGDFVNNTSDEMDKFLEVLSKLKSKYGNYSILGNHDYGEYVRWDSEEAKKNNLERLKNLQRQVGFDLLLNENRKIKIEDESIELVGVENWGLPPFPQYGDLKKALTNVDDDSFKILMSHDPTHWDEEVYPATNIDLTLSGHTHGAQFGIEIPGWRWSPVNMRYKRWGGLYTEGKQHLHVNTGIGFIGFPGRVGMPPEITVIELERI
ncbi:MAG: metallophosphoesterase [Ignavibacteriales bacterium]|nr:metallophosphoesterase [Ignavibacteriota bacterium]MCB9248445.1 metallophosphoesterase [Ignavibacteriales bacterium]